VEKSTSLQSKQAFKISAGEVFLCMQASNELSLKILQAGWIFPFFAVPVHTYLEQPEEDLPLVVLVDLYTWNNQKRISLLLNWLTLIPGTTRKGSPFIPGTTRRGSPSCCTG